MDVNFVCHTSGTGYWSTKERSVRCLKLSVNTWEDPGEVPDHGELCITFDVDTATGGWDVRKHGLIYTDSLFELELAQELVKLGFSEAAAQDVSYSEQGMQGEDYVSCDVGEVFLNEWFDDYRNK